VWPRPEALETESRLEAVVVQNVRTAFEQVDFNRLQGYVDRVLYAAQAHALGADGASRLRFLDYGCGFGRVTAAAKWAGFRTVHGYDPSKAMVGLARQAVPEPGVMFTHRLDDLPEQYDLIVCEDVIEHCLEPISLLKSLFSRLAPGGILFLTTPVISGLSGRILGQAWWVPGRRTICSSTRHRLWPTRPEASVSTWWICSRTA